MTKRQAELHKRAVRLYPDIASMYSCRAAGVETLVFHLPRPFDVNLKHTFVPQLLHMDQVIVTRDDVNRRLVYREYNPSFFRGKGRTEPPFRAFYP